MLISNVMRMNALYLLHFCSLLLRGYLKSPSCILRSRFWLKCDIWSCWSSVVWTAGSGQFIIQGYVFSSCRGTKGHRGRITKPTNDYKGSQRPWFRSPFLGLHCNTKPVRLDPRAVDYLHKVVRKVFWSDGDCIPVTIQCVRKIKSEVITFSTSSSWRCSGCRRKRWPILFSTKR